MHTAVPNLVAREGCTVLQDGIQPSADIVFVHGLQGHPKKTWLCQRAESGDKSSQTRLRAALKTPWKALTRALPDRKRATRPPCIVVGESGPDENAFFWPRDALGLDFPNARVMTFGYDSDVTHFFKLANQNNIRDHSRTLLNAIVAERGDYADRPVIFIAHSLGGILVKAALRLSEKAQKIPGQVHLGQLYDATTAIVFLSTPHRGADAAGWGVLLANIAAVCDTNQTVLRDLDPKVDTGMLEELREDFATMLETGRLRVQTFQEAKGMAAAKTLNNKVVPNASSSLDSVYESKDTINANHMQMCRFRSREDPEYKKVKGAIERFLLRRDDSRPSIPRSEESRQLVVPGGSQRNSERSSRRSSDITVAPEGPVHNIVAAQEQHGFVFH